MSKSKIKNKNTSQVSKPVILYLLIGLMIILLPLLFSKNTIDPVISLRMLAWNIFLLILLVPLIYNFIQKQIDFRFLRLAVFPVFLFYLLLTAISAFFAFNPVEAYFDLSKTFLSLVLLIVATEIFSKSQDYKTLITKGFIISTIIAGLNGLFQYFNISPVESDTELYSTLYQIGGIMGHKNQFAISLFLLLPFCVFGLFKFRRYWLALSIVATLIIFVNIILLQTRSVWLSSLIFLFFNVILFFVNSSAKNKEVKWFKNPLLILIVGFFAIALLVFSLQSENTKNLIGYKIGSLLSFDSHDNKGRIGVWNGTMEMIGDHPLVGVGAGNWKLHIPEYIVDTHDKDYKNWKQPHNDLLWIWSEKGFLALLSYLLVFILIIIYGVKALKASNDSSDKIFLKLMFSGIAGYLVLALVTFPYDRVNHQVVLMIIFAAILAEYSQLKQGFKSPSKLIMQSVFGTLALLLLLSLFYNYKSWESKKYTKTIYTAISQNNARAVLNYANLAMNPYVSIDEQQAPLIKHRGTAYAMLGRNTEAISDLLLALKENPNHISTLNNLATLYAKNGQFELAITYFEKALDVFPKNQQSIKGLSRAYFDSGQIEQSYLTILRYSNNKPDPQVQGFKEKLEGLLNE